MRIWSFVAQEIIAKRYGKHDHDEEYPSAGHRGDQKTAHRYYTAGLGHRPRNFFFVERGQICVRNVCSSTPWRLGIENVNYKNTPNTVPMLVNTPLSRYALRYVPNSKYISIVV